MDKLIWLFLKDYEKWVCKGCKPNKYFRIDAGLCHNLTTWWLAKSKGTKAEYSVELHLGTCRKLAIMFMEDGLNPYYPFNKDYKDYESQCIHHRAHKNKKRMAWVRSKL